MSAAAGITVRVPLVVRSRPGRKTVVTQGETAGGFPVRTRADPAMVKALARAFRWKRMLEDGRYASISEIADAEKIDRGSGDYVGNRSCLVPQFSQIHDTDERDDLINHSSGFRTSSMLAACENTPAPCHSLRFPTM